MITDTMGRFEYVPKVPPAQDLDLVFNCSFSEVQPYLFKVESRCPYFNEGFKNVFFDVTLLFICYLNKCLKIVTHRSYQARVMFLLLVIEKSHKPHNCPQLNTQFNTYPVPSQSVGFNVKKLIKGALAI